MGNDSDSMLDQISSIIHGGNMDTGSSLNDTERTAGSIITDDDINSADTDSAEIPLEDELSAIISGKVSIGDSNIDAVEVFL